MQCDWVGSMCDRERFPWKQACVWSLNVKKKSNGILITKLLFFNQHVQEYSTFHLEIIIDIQLYI